MNNNTEKQSFYIMPLIMAIILFISMADLPYAFYTIMRIVLPVMSVIYLFFAFIFTDGFHLMHIPNILIVILWNPILPVYLDKETWIIIDAIAGASQIIMTFYAYRLEKQN